MGTHQLVKKTYHQHKNITIKTKALIPIGIPNTKISKKRRPQSLEANTEMIDKISNFQKILRETSDETETSNAVKFQYGK